MKFQLVLQFNEELGFDKLIEIENLLIGNLQPDISEVDGHDIGSGQMNIFIFTSLPSILSEDILKILNNMQINTSDIRIAYRDIESENYICLWPKNLKEFYVI